MELKVYIPQPAQKAVASLDPSQVWVARNAVDDPRPRPAADERPYSFLAECECPVDCLRDHENE